MTRVYRSPTADHGLRVLVVGAGDYDYPAAVPPGLPRLAPLDSVAPSVFAFVERLIGPWRETLAMPLFSIDLVLSDADKPAGTLWPGFGVPGEVASGSAIAPATLAEVNAALAGALQGATPADGLLCFFCGHGFSRGSRYFVLSDFGMALNPWRRVIDLDGLKLSLRQTPPRTQWLFWDCCADIPQEAVEALTDLGDPLIPPRASELAHAAAAYGPLSQFGAASAPLGEQAFAMPGQPSRFTEMLVEALEMAGATRRQGGVWWVSDRGVMDALSTYARRHAGRSNPAFYDFVTPFSSDAPTLMRFRRLDAPPHSTLLARSRPDQAALKAAKVRVERDAAPPGELVAYEQPPRPATSLLRLDLAPLQHYTLTVQFEGADDVHTVSCFADLPLAEELELPSP